MIPVKILLQAFCTYELCRVLIGGTEFTHTSLLKEELEVVRK